MNLLIRLFIILIILIIPLSLPAKIRDYISIKAQKDISLSDLIMSSGFEIEDDKVVHFLENFSRLNENIKSLRLIPKGKIIRLPLKYLKFSARVIKGERRVTKPKVSKVSDKEIELLTHNIKKLFEYIGESISVRTGNIIVFPVTEKATLSVDTDYLPLFEVSGYRLILLDIKKSLPREVRDIIEVYWPEYTVVSGRDIKGIINQVLDTIDYICLDDGRLIIGDDLLAEIKPDCILVRKDKDIIDSDIIILGITKNGESGFPESLLMWAKDIGINIVDLSMEEQPRRRKEAKLFVLPEQKKEFIPAILSHLGYKVRKNVGLSITDEKDYRFNLMADIAFESGRKTKIIDLSGLPQSALGILKKHGIDIISIDIKDDSRNIIEEILNFLSLPMENHPERVSEIITPKKVKYRVKTKGILVRSETKDNLLFSDYHNAELLRSLIDEKISLIKYN